MFNARAFVANQFGCEPGEFTIIRKPVEGYRGREATYAGDGRLVRILVSKPRGASLRGGLHSQRDVHRRVVATWPGGQSQTRIAVDDEVVW